MAVDEETLCWAQGHINSHSCTPLAVDERITNVGSVMKINFIGATNAVF